MLPVVPNNFWLFKNELPFFVLLWCLICPLIFPPEHLTAINTMHISNSVETRHEMPVFFWSHCDIHGMGEQKSTPMSSLLRKFNTKTVLDNEKVYRWKYVSRSKFQKCIPIYKFNLKFQQDYVNNTMTIRKRSSLSLYNIEDLNF